MKFLQQPAKEKKVAAYIKEERKDTLANLSLTEAIALKRDPTKI